MKAWIKGGLIALVINLALIVLYFMFTGGTATYDNPVSLLMMPSFLITDALYWGANSTLAIIIISSLCYFVVGALIGWIVGKVKSRQGGKN